MTLGLQSLSLNLFALMLLIALHYCAESSFEAALFETALKLKMTLIQSSNKARLANGKSDGAVAFCFSRNICRPVLLTMAVFCCFFLFSLAAFAYSNDSSCAISCQELSNAFLSPDERAKPEDIIIVLDSSKSMQGNAILRAKTAAKEFIDIVESDDRVAIVSFSRDAEVMQRFSYDKDATKESIDKIALGNSTNYVPALEAAHRLFLSDGNKSHNWKIIFISDGAPKDSEAAIFSSVNSLLSDEICLNTIGYNLFRGSRAENTLMRIASASRDAVGCGNYFFSPDSKKVFYQMIESAYHEGFQRKPDISLSYFFNENTKSLALAAYVNNASVYASLSEVGYPECMPEAAASIKGSSGKEYLKSLAFDKRSGFYRLSLSSFEPGSYNVSVALSFPVCGVSGRKSFTIEIPEKCRLSCLGLSRILFSSPNRTIFVNITDSGFSPEQISIDDSTLVVWRNSGSGVHSVIESSGLFNSGKLYPSDFFSYFFSKAGNYSYYDSFSGRNAGIYNSERAYNISNTTINATGAIDFVLLIDSSGSMHGRKLGILKEAINSFISELQPGDRAAIVSFSDDAKVISGFGDDKQLLNRKLDGISAGGSTRYIPALRKASMLFSSRRQISSRNKAIIFFSDGQPWDNGKPESIFKELNKLLSGNACFYAIGFEIGSDSPVLEKMSSLAKKAANGKKCGGYIYTESEKMLSEAFGLVYYYAKSGKKKLRIILHPEAINGKAAIKTLFFNGYRDITRDLLKACGLRAAISYKLYKDGFFGKSLYAERLINLSGGFFDSYYLNNSPNSSFHGKGYYSLPYYIGDGAVYVPINISNGRYYLVAEAEFSGCSYSAAGKKEFAFSRNSIISTDEKKPASFYFIAAFAFLFFIAYLIYAIRLKRQSNSN